MANVYKADQAVNAFKIAQPQGGFQVGAWYNGRQYWTNPSDGQGYFSDPGVINPFSTQPGAGQAVNPEVVRAGSIQQGLAPDANQQYIQQQTQIQPEQMAQAGIAPIQVGDLQAQAINGLSAGGGGGMGAGVGFQGQQPVNLLDMYSQIKQNTGISEKQQQLVDSEKQYLEARSEISNNPFASASIIDNKLRRLRQTYEKETQPIRDEIAMKQADADTQLQLQMKQLDINNQMAQQALQQFEFLLSSGALSNASGQDIANITRSTGLSSTMIQNAIAQAKKANATPPKIVQYDDGKNQGYVMIDPDTGQIVGRQVIAGSKPSSSGSGSDMKVGSTEWKIDQTQKINTFINTYTNDYGHMEPADWKAAAQAYENSGLGTRQDFINAYGERTDPYRPDFSNPNTGYGFSKDKRNELTGEYF